MARAVAARGARSPQIFHMVEIANINTLKTTIVPAGAGSSVLPPPKSRVTVFVIQSPPIPAIRLSRMLPQNICRKLRPKFAAVAAGTTNMALMSNAPTARKHKFTISARRTINR